MQLGEFLSYGARELRGIGGPRPIKLPQCTVEFQTNCKTPLSTTTLVIAVAGFVILVVVVFVIRASCKRTNERRGGVEIPNSEIDDQEGPRYEPDDAPVRKISIKVPYLKKDNGSNGIKPQHKKLKPIHCKV